MIKKIIILTVLILNLSLAIAQSLFQNSYDASANLEIKNSESTQNGIIICGTTEPNTASSDGFITKTDLDGNVVWSFTYGGNDEDVINAVKQTSDGGYIATGYTKSSGAGDMDALLIKIGANGGIIWQKTYGTSTIDYGKDVIQTSDGGYAICGTARDEFAVSDKGAIYIFKTTSSGTLSWSKMYGSDSWYFSHSIMEAPNGDLIITGGGLSGKLLLINMSNSGNLQWHRGIMPDNINSCSSSKVIITSDNNYMILISGDHISTTKKMISLIKTDFSGVELWTKDYYFSSYDGIYNGIAKIWGGGFLTSGKDDMYFFTMRIDSAGVLASARTSSVASGYGGFNLTRLSDGTYVSAGGHSNNIFISKCNWAGATGCVSTDISVNESLTSLFFNSLQTPWTSTGTTIVNTASLSSTNLSLSKNIFCSSAVGIKNTEAEAKITAYPNPFEDEFTIDLGEEMENVEVKVYDMLSREVYSAFYIRAQEIIVPRDKIKAGIYYSTISINGNIISASKLIAQ